MTQEQNSFFEKIFFQYFEEVVCYCYRILHDWGEAQDAAQEAFVTGYQKIDVWFTAENPIGWIKMTAQYVSRNKWKKKQKRDSIQAPFAEWDKRTAVNDPEQGLEFVLEHCREILSEREYRDFQATILAGEPACRAHKELGISQETCKRRVTRIKQKLRKNWKLEK